LGIYLKEGISSYHRYTCIPMIVVAVFTIAKLWNQSQCPKINEWIKKVWLIYKMEYCIFSNKEE
jgi:hypothetical protein